MNIENEDGYIPLNPEQQRIQNIDAALISSSWTTGEKGFGFEFNGLDATQTTGQGYVCPNNIPLFEMVYSISIQDNVPFLTVKGKVNNQPVETTYKIVDINSGGNGTLIIQEGIKEPLHLSHPHKK